MLAALLLAGSASAADDPAIMTIAGEEIPRSEFEYSYKKNNGAEVIDRKTAEEYVPLFVNYKLKVRAALDARLDTLTSYKEEFRRYRDMQITPTFVSEADLERCAKGIYDDTKRRIGPGGLLHVRHILLRVDKDASEANKKRQKTLADSVYNAIRKGADFAELAKRKSADTPSARRGGEVGWMSRGQTLKAFDEAAFKLKDGEVSKPVLSEAGYHIIKVEGRKQLEPYDTLRADIRKYMERTNMRKALAANCIDSLAAQKGISKEEVMDERADELAATDPKMRYLISEYHDGLLLYEICNRQVWERVANDEALLTKYFKKNRKKFAWNEPRFKGIAYHARRAEDIEAVKKALKGKGFGEWKEVLRSTFNNDSVLRIRAEKGVFKKGANGLVDRDRFGVADAKVREKKGFPYAATYGKMIKTPEELSDVRPLVVADCQEAEEKTWLTELRKKYAVTINKEVVKTVPDVKIEK